MRIAEAMHVDCFDTDARATIATLAATDTLTSIFFTVAPGVESVILSTHDVRCELFNWKLLEWWLVFRLGWIPFTVFRRDRPAVMSVEGGESWCVDQSRYDEVKVEYSRFEHASWNSGV